MRPFAHAIALAAALAVAGCATNPFSPPPPGDSPGAYPPVTAAPTPPPADAVTEANLPTADDLVWNETRWSDGETREGSGVEPLTVCQENRLETLGPTAIWVRTFQLGQSTDQLGESTAGSGAAVAMSFESTELADQAYTTLQEWVATCTDTLEAQNRTDIRQTVQEHPIDVPEGRAQFTEWAYAVGPDLGEFESQGLYQADERVGLLVMRTQGQDNNWDLEPDGPVGSLHPQIRSVPPAAAKLAG